MFAEGESSGMRIFATALLAIALGVGVCGVLFCCAATFETALTGYPSFAGTGYVIYSATEEDELPDGTLVAFEKGTSFDWRAGDFAVFRTVRGMGVGRVSKVGADRLTLRLGEGGVLAVPFVAVLGRALRHYPAAGRALVFLAQSRGAGFAGGIAIAVTAFISLIIERRDDRMLSAV